MSEKVLDFCIVGAGPIGLTCGIEAVKAGLSYVIVDKGCLVNSLYNYPRNMTFFSTSDRLEIGEVPFISHGPKPTRSESLEYYRRVAASWKLKTQLYERIEEVDKKNNVFHIRSNKSCYKARNLIIATGFYDLPYPLNVSGEELPKVKHYYDEPHPYFDMHIAVVGAANSAVDVALEVYRKGACSVTMVIREPEINSRVKYWVKPDIDNRIKEGSIKAYFNSQITKIEKYAIEIQTKNKTLLIPNDFVLAMTGYQPDFKFLNHIGINIGNDEFKTPCYNPETMETNIAGAYLAGVICGGLKTNEWFIENSRVHAEIIVKNVLAKISAD
ncbi:MAG: YpdA family putative bacillithiol disulfide reductase [Bacteroidota bacterium]